MQVRRLEFKILELEAEREAVAASDQRVVEMGNENQMLTEKLRTSDAIISELSNTLELAEAECAFIADDQEERREAATKDLEIKDAQNDYYLSDMMPSLEEELKRYEARDKQLSYELGCMREHHAQSVRR